MEPTMIEGLAEALDKGTVVSNYTNPEYTWEVIRNFKGGNAVFTQPTTYQSAAVHRRRSPIWQQIISVRKELQISPMSSLPLRERSFWCEAYCPYPDGGHQPLRHSFQALLCTSSH